MKDLRIYIKESQEDGKNGHWEYRTDSNGKASRIWIDYEEIVRQRKAAEAAIKAADKKKLQNKQDKKKAIEDINKAEDRMMEINQELKDLEQQHRDLMIDMEDELGQILYPDSKPSTKETEAAAEERAQDYGEQFNEIEEQIEKLNKEYDGLDKKCNELRKKWNL